MENICMEESRFDCARDYWHCCYSNYINVTVISMVQTHGHEKSNRNSDKE